jgi:general secretion pathway protein L
MTFLRRLALLLSRWIDDVAWALMSLAGLIRPQKRFRVVEQEELAFLVQGARRRSAPSDVATNLRFVDGQFVEEAGGRIRSRLERGNIEIVLARRRFVFRSMEFPRQAAGFLDSIVRSQIDRITPWGPSQAAYGCGPPTQLSGGRIGVVVVATARSSIMPFVTAMEALKPNAVLISAGPEIASDEGERQTIVFSQQTNRELSMRRLRRFLVGAPAVAGLVAIAAFAAWMIVGADVEDSRVLVSRQLAERRVALLSGRPGVSEEATAKLAQKKRESAATVVVLDSLSQALPDDTYLTELHVADGKLEITGVTREAAALIGIIEQTNQFKQATFFAPTTRSPQEIGEQFHIQAQIVPYFPASP